MHHFETPQIQTRRHAIRCWVGIVLACLTSLVSAQSAWPDKPVRIIVPTAAGSGSDLIARTLAQRLSEIWKQSVVVENKAGASGIIGVDAVVKAAPDGFTLLMSSASPLVINPVIFRKLPHDPLKQLAPVSHVGIAPAAFLVNGATAVTNLKELVALAKAQPKKLSYGSFGLGSGAHLAIEAFNQSAGIDMIHVPYKGTGPAVSDLIAGQITLTLADLATAQTQIKAGKLRAIAINGPARSPLLPDVATFTEQAYPAMEGTYARFGLLAPVGTPQVILNKVSADTITALNDPMVSERFTSLGYSLTGSTPEKLRIWLKEDAERWGKVIQAIGGIVLD